MYNIYREETSFGLTESKESLIYGYKIIDFPLHTGLDNREVEFVDKKIRKTRQGWYDLKSDKDFVRSEWRHEPSSEIDPTKRESIGGPNWEGKEVQKRIVGVRVVLGKTSKMIKVVGRRGWVFGK